MQPRTITRSCCPSRLEQPRLLQLALGSDYHVCPFFLFVFPAMGQGLFFHPCENSPKCSYFLPGTLASCPVPSTALKCKHPGGIPHFPSSLHRKPKQTPYKPCPHLPGTIGDMDGRPHAFEAPTERPWGVTGSGPAQARTRVVSI